MVPCLYETFITQERCGGHSELLSWAYDQCRAPSGWYRDCQPANDIEASTLLTETTESSNHNAGSSIASDAAAEKAVQWKPKGKLNALKNFFTVTRKVIFGGVEIDIVSPPKKTPPFPGNMRRCMNARGLL